MTASTGPTPAFATSPLTPLAFLDRARQIFADRTAIVDGDDRFTYADYFTRSQAMAHLLEQTGVSRGDRVAALCSNSHIMLELHLAVPMLHASLVALNVRLSGDELAYILEHSGARVLVATTEFEAEATVLAERVGIRLVLEQNCGQQMVDDLSDREPFGLTDVDENEQLAINYTSGTTGHPKGVVYRHRGAYLQALAMAYHADLRVGSRYLWTLPMFHCNGWCFTWAITAAGGVHVCLRKLTATSIWSHLTASSISHFSAAPTVLTLIAAATPAGRAPFTPALKVQTGGAPPSPSLLHSLTELGIDVTHLYGLTETYGPVAVNIWEPEWDQLPAGEREQLRARQGVANVIARPLRVLAQGGADVPADGVTMGEVAVAGNDVMDGYFKDPEATATATEGGWFRTGDVGVKHPNGMVELRDRSKDIIISGGENISSVEVEQALDSHPAVLECAVVASPDPHWGEVAVAFVVPNAGADLDVEELRAFVRSKLAGFKVPKRIVVSPLPKTGTGKIRKNVLRDHAASAVGQQPWSPPHEPEVGASP